jgi:cytochrome c-type biogenesis protein CcmH
MKTFIHLVAFVLALLFASVSFAWEPKEVLADPALEERARTISAGVRCLVCQNQSIDDSDADLAKDLRLLVRERLTAGDTDEAVFEFLVSRYGEFILLKPKFGLSTALLWSLPGLLLLTGGLIAWRSSKKGTGFVSKDELSSAEQARISQIIDRQ